MKRLTSATAIGLILAATPALAEMTPKSVWENLSSYYDSYGLTVEAASVDDAGDTLTVNDLVLTQKAESGETRIDMGDVVFSATGDGAVRMDLADEATLTLDLPEPPPVDEAALDADATQAADADTSGADAAAQATTDAADATTDADVAAQATNDTAADAANAAAQAAADAAAAAEAAAGDAANDAGDAAADAEAAAEEAAAAAQAEMAAEQAEQPSLVTLTAKIANEDITIREDGDAIVYDYLLPKLDMTVTQIELNNGKVITNPATIALVNLKGSDRVEGKKAQKIVKAATIESATFNLAVDNEDGQKATGQFVFGGLAMNSDTAMPADSGTMADDFSAMLKAGMTLKGDLKIASITGNLDMVTKDEEGQMRPVALKMDSADNALTFAIDQARINYAGVSGATKGELTVPDFPVPMGYGLTDTKFNVDFPIAVSDQPQNFTVSYLLNGVTMTDSIWALFDPQAALPRDPASIDVDLAGSIKVLRDFFDPATMEAAAKMEDPNLSDEQRAALMEEMMAPPVDLRDITINKVALNMLGAKADVTGKLAAPEQGDMQEPVGTISGKFEGVPALLEKLGSMGLVPAEQMMGVQMMLQMFSKPDAQNPNVLTTELEFKEGGQVFANGQQVK